MRWKHRSVILTSLLLAACGQHSTPTRSPAPQANTSPKVATLPFQAGGQLDGKPTRAATLRAQSATDRSGWETVGAPGHLGNSPNDFPEPAPTTIVSDRDGSNDIYQFRVDGNHTINLTVPYVIPNVKEAINSGALAPTATISMPVYDIDMPDLGLIDCYPDPNYTPDTYIFGEMDRVLFNGRDIGRLTGTNNAWLQNTFTIPVEWINFPSAPGMPARNTLTVEIDTANAGVACPNFGDRIWATEIDWVALGFKAADPAAFVHGIANTGEKFDKGDNPLPPTFRDKGFPVMRPSVSLTQAPLPKGVIPDCWDAETYNTIGRHATELMTYLQTRLPGYGSNRVNLVGHSKGGLDTRGLMSKYNDGPSPSGGARLSELATFGTMMGAPLQRPITVNSWTTLNTPQGGSPLADVGLSLYKIQNPLPTAQWFERAIQGFTHMDYLCELTPSRRYQENYSKSFQGQVNTSARAVGTTINPLLSPPRYTVASWRLAANNVTIRDQSGAEVTSFKSLFGNPNDGVVPAWSSFLAPATAQLNGFPAADHTYVAEQQNVADRLYAELNPVWRVK